MKKTIFLSAFVLAAVISTVVYSQSSPETMSRIRDNTTATAVADVTQLGGTQLAANYGLNVAAGCYYVSGITWYSWSGGLANSDAVDPATTRAPYVQTLGMYYDGTNWKRITGETYDGALATTNAPVFISLGAYWDGSASARWAGEAWDTDMGVTTNPNVNAFGVFRDLTGAKNGQWSGELWSGDMTQPLAAPNVNALGVFRETANSKNIWWNGIAAADNMPAGQIAPFTLSLGTFYRTDNTAAYQRWTGEVWGATMTTAPEAPFVNSLGVFYNTDGAAGTKGYRLTGETVDSSMTAAPVAPWVAAYTTFYNGTNSQYWQGSVLSSETTANTTYAPHTKNHNYCYDATSGSWRWVNVIDSQADGQASTLNGMVTSSIGYAYNGSSFDMMRVGASNELQTTDIATRPGEDAANDWRKVKKEQTGVYTPAATTGTAVTAGTSPVIVLAAIEAMSDINWCVYLKNTDGADAFTDAFIDTSPNNSDWVTLTWTECDSLAAGAVCVYCVSNNAYRYIRARVSSAADLTVSAWYVANKG